MRVSVIGKRARLHGLHIMGSMRSDGSLADPRPAMHMPGAEVAGSGGQLVAASSLHLPARYSALLTLYHLLSRHLPNA